MANATLANATLETALEAMSAAQKHFAPPVAAAASQVSAFATEQLPKAAGAIVSCAWNNPVTTAGTVFAAGGLAIVAVPAAVSAPALAFAGFGCSGIGAGTIAAGVQSGIGNVVAGSLFAGLQSAGAGGAGLAVVNGVVQIGGGAMAAVGSGVAINSKL